MGIAGISSRQCSWRGSDTDANKAQIDLLIDRRDGIINLCEIKFSDHEYSITKSYETELLNKVSVFKASTATKKSIHLVMVTTFGIQKNSHSAIIQNEVTLDDLFG